MDHVFYGTITIDRLVDGAKWSDFADDWTDVPGAWADLRSTIERTGEISSDGWLQVLDLEIALGRLRQYDPQSALIVLARINGFDHHELESLFGRRYALKLEKAKAFLAAWLNGQDEEHAYGKRIRSQRLMARP